MNHKRNDQSLMSVESVWSNIKNSHYVLPEK
jgi:hypothetical protein